jgi:hypothetical protein
MSAVGGKGDIAPTCWNVAYLTPSRHPPDCGRKSAFGSKSEIDLFFARGGNGPALSSSVVVFLFLIQINQGWPRGAIAANTSRYRG